MIIKSILIFILTGICEIAGGYLVWIWIKEDKSIWYGVFGGLILFLYGLAATLQTESFARTYAAYGGFFIVLALLWAWKIDNYTSDQFDIIGAGIILIGVCFIYYTPRS